MALLFLIGSLVGLFAEARLTEKGTYALTSSSIYTQT